jgi:hypothetical protein
MRGSKQYSSDPGLPGAAGPGLAGPGKRPWFGPKRVGSGYRPQTWQGWIVALGMVAAIVAAGALAPNTVWFWVTLVVAILIPPAIIARQRR